MKTRGIKDLYLPDGIAFHVKIIILCAIFTPIWGLYMNEFSLVFLIGTFSMTVANVEIILFISRRYFRVDEVKIRKLEENYSQKTVTLINLIGILVFLMVALAVITLTFSSFIIVLHLLNGWGFPDAHILLSETGDAIKVAAIALLFSVPFIFFSKWQEAMKREYELREQNLIFQNQTLRSQVNPHFLFNSLNTLSSLVNTQTEIANRFINKLSLIYRYILENSSKVKVPLNDELEFIRDYFYLHQIRNEGKILLSFDVKDSLHFEILPVSLQLLIENAIKHNIATYETPLRIAIYIEEQYIVIKNNIQKMATQVISTKIGLKNLNDRVKLIVGKEIIIKETVNEFMVKVPLLS
ncbi:MAG TPA: histidine kinase [Bacteroidales bacterium]|nr:histidine kinase [Bacteroidales bacterium]